MFYYFAGYFECIILLISAFNQMNSNKKWQSICHCCMYANLIISKIVSNRRRFFYEEN